MRKIIVLEFISLGGRARSRNPERSWRRISAGWPGLLILRTLPTQWVRRFSQWELEEIANLFCDEVLTSVKRSIDVLKPERHRLVLPKPWA